MRPVNEKAPEPVVAGSGAEGVAYEKLQPNLTAHPDSMPALREMQAIVAALLVTADRVDAAGCRLLALAGGAQ